MRPSSLPTTLAFSANWLPYHLSDNTPAPTGAPVLWGDWPRCQLRRRWMRLLRTQTVELIVRALPAEADLTHGHDAVQTRAERAHWRLSWQQRLARNARPASAPAVEITIYGLPAALAAYVGINQVTAA